MAAPRCVSCGAPATERAMRGGHCDTCAAEAELLSGSLPAAQSPRPRANDPGRILRTGAASALPTQPVSTMPRLMTADIEAARLSSSADETGHATMDAFVLSDAPMREPTQEAWSLGESPLDGEATPPQVKRGVSVAQKLLMAVAMLAAAGGVAWVMKLRSAPNQSIPSSLAGSGSGDDQAPLTAPVQKSDKTAQPNPAPKAPSAPAPSVKQNEFVAGSPATPPAVQAAAEPAPAAAPLNFDARMREGRAALDKGNLDAARSAFEEAARQKPLSAEAVTGIARTLAASEDHAGAIRAFEKAVVLGPDYLPAWSGLAYLRSLTGNRDGAIDAYRRVIAIAPNARDAATAREALTDLGVTEP